jgi:hypothetical protein
VLLPGSQFLVQAHFFFEIGIELPTVKQCREPSAEFSQYISRSVVASAGACRCASAAIRI